MSKYHERQAASDMMRLVHHEETKNQFLAREKFLAKRIKPVTWQELMQLQEKKAHRRALIDSILCAVGITAVITMAVWIGPVVQLFRKAGWL